MIKGVVGLPHLDQLSHQRLIHKPGLGADEQHAASDVGSVGAILMVGVGLHS